MDHCVLNSSDLHKLLQDTLLITEKVKEILKRNCNEATFVLKPWQMKIIIEKQVDESICNCKKITSENEAKEIAAGISRTIVLAQELREKLKLNVATKKKSMRKDTIENIYLSNSTSINNRKKLSKSNIAMQKANAAKSPDCKKASTFQNDKAATAVTKRSLSPKLANSTKQINVTDKIQSNKLPKKVTINSKKGKNFILENKLNIKRISSANKLQVDDSASSDISQDIYNTMTERKTLDSPTMSAVKLNDLIHKTHQSIDSVLIPSADNDKNTCPIHEHNLCRFIEEQIVMIDVVEALQHFTVPNEIVKVLKTYYTFLETEEANSDDKEKKTKSVDAFLKAFKATNVVAQDCSLQESQLLEAAADSIFVFNNTFSEDLDPMQLNSIRNTFIDLGVVLKSYKHEDIAKPITKGPFCNISLTRRWMLNGIWNASFTEQLKSFSKSYNVKYSNKKQLLSLYEAMQKLQRTEYLNTLIGIILRDVIPTVKFNIDPTSTEYIQAYKMMYILYQGLNPKIPVLVRTDN